jgi:hypothetical protein
VKLDCYALDYKPLSGERNGRTACLLEQRQIAIKYHAKSGIGSETSSQKKRISLLVGQFAELGAGAGNPEWEHDKGRKHKLIGTVPVHGSGSRWIQLSCKTLTHAPNPRYSPTPAHGIKTGGM